MDEAGGSSRRPLEGEGGVPPRLPFLPSKMLPEAAPAPPLAALHWPQRERLPSGASRYQTSSYSDESASGRLCVMSM